MSKRAFDKIAEGLNEALAVARGTASAARMVVPAEIDVRSNVWEIAAESVGTFSELHPGIQMNLGQWEDLKECIEREVRRAFCDEDISARDLLPKADNSGPLSPGV